MNLHVTSDNYGLFPKEVAKRIKNHGSTEKNYIVNLGEYSVIRDEIITYIPDSIKSIKDYINHIDKPDKIIFHPYKFSCYEFLKLTLKKFPKIKVYWAFWSFELYNLSHLPIEHFLPYSKNYIKKKMTLPERIKENKIVGNLVLKLTYATGIKENYIKNLVDSFKHIDFFCSFLPSDFLFYQKVSSNKKTKYIPFLYLSLEEIMPGLSNFKCVGNKIMVGHASSPYGNHYEILQLLSKINSRFDIFIPIAYGDEVYGNLIEKKAKRLFPNSEIQREKLDSFLYHKKLTEVGWCIINVKVQQGLGNIIALIWMGAKVFLDEDSSTYKDFSEWGIIIFSIQRHLNLRELSNKLTESEIENNKSKIFEKCNEKLVKQYWDKILN